MNGNKADIHNKALQTERRLRVLELYKSGITSCRNIAKVLETREGGKYAISKDTISRDIRRCLADLRKEQLSETEDMRALERARLDDELRAIWPQVRNGNPRAIEVALKIQERMAKLYGLDAPVKSELTGKDGAPVEIVDWRHEFSSRITRLAARLTATSDTGNPHPGTGEGTAV